MSAITDLKKTRVAASAPVKLGQWHAGFSTVKAYAGNNAVPLFGVWAEDSCGKSNAFCKALLSADFKKWQRSSGVALWCGFHSDKNKEDGYEGKGFKWTRKDTLTQYPFVRLYWKAGKVDVCMSGADWGATGAAIVKKLKTYLKGYTPTPAPAPTPEPTIKVSPLVALPCAATALEAALHGVCDTAGWDGTVKYADGKLVIETAE